MREIWKPVVGYAGLYEVSTLARVQSLSRVTFDQKGHPHRTIGRVLTPHAARDGYHRVWLCKQGCPKLRLIHRMVAEAFIANPLALPQVNHLDGDKNNNALPNLEWVTASQNFRHALRTGLTVMASGERLPQSKLTRAAVQDIRAQRAAGVPLKALAQKYGVGIGAISHVANGRNWKHV
jgi:hypothetical protein